MKTLLATIIIFAGSLAFGSTSTHAKISETIQMSNQALLNGEVSYAESALRIALNHLAETGNSTEKLDNLDEAQELLDTAGANFNSTKALQSKIDRIREDSI